MKPIIKNKFSNRLNICFKSNVILFFCKDYDLHQSINTDYVSLKKNFCLLKFDNKALIHFLIRTSFINIKQVFLSSLITLYPIKTFYTILNKDLFLCEYFVGLIFFHNFYLTSQIKSISCLNFYNNISFFLSFLKTTIRFMYYKFSK